MPTTRRPPSSKVPAYRRRSGYTQALVTLTDAATKKRRDFWLGEFGTTESRERLRTLFLANDHLGERASGFNEKGFHGKP